MIKLISHCRSNIYSCSTWSKTVTLFFFLGFLMSTGYNSSEAVSPPNHKTWNHLLNKHVSENGVVNYQGFKKDRAMLDRYTETLSNTPPQKKRWSMEEQLAYWINVYNAFTVKIIVDHYPVKSILEIGNQLNLPGDLSVWDHPFVLIDGKKYSLNEIEHEIIRIEFDEPRIHFAVNCAAKSCPILLNEAYTADRLDEQLQQQTARFINDQKFNKIHGPNKAEVSRIFDWYTEDFTKNGQTIAEYIDSYSQQKLNSDAKITFKAYNWDLNN